MRIKVILVVVIALAIAISLISGKVKTTESIRTNIRDAGIKQEQHNLQIENELKSTKETLQREQEENKKLNDALVSKAKEKAAKPIALVAVAKAAPAPTPALPSGTYQDWMRAAGISDANFGYANFIVMHEGSFNPCVINGGAVDCTYASNGGQKAYGVCQSLPGSKMATAGADWATNPITQLRWCNSYAVARYGGWLQAYNYWLAHRVW